MWSVSKESLVEKRAKNRENTQKKTCVIDERKDWEIRSMFKVSNKKQKKKKYSVRDIVVERMKVNEYMKV